MTTKTASLRFLSHGVLGVVLLLPVAGATAQQAAAASPESGMSVYVQGARSPGSRNTTNSITLGLTGPLLPGRDWLGARLYWEAFASQWRAPDPASARVSYTQLAFVPTARWRLDGGQSPWFIDAGVGLSYLDGDYATPRHRFGTRWNFTERLAVGRSFGRRHQHEVALAFQHFSNAGMKKPNPGENFVALRYATRF